MTGRHGTLEERFWPKVDRWDPDECWPWTGYRSPLGYGQVRGADGRTKMAYQVAYRLLIGPVPDGLELDHLCRVPGCVNPKHLEPVTHRENILRGEGFAARQARQTHCKRGHPFDATNTVIDGKGRKCRICKRAKDNRAYHRKRSEAGIAS